MRRAFFAAALALLLAAPVAAAAQDAGTVSDAADGAFLDIDQGWATQDRAVDDTKRVAQQLGGSSDPGGATALGPSPARLTDSRDWVALNVRTFEIPVAQPQAPSRAPPLAAPSTRAALALAATSAKQPAAATRVGAVGRSSDGSGGSGASSSRIDAYASNVATVAVSGSAETDIGTSSSGGTRSITSAKNVVTTAIGGTTATSIGGCDGVVSAENIYNEGGDLTICPGRTTRNGMTCIEIYLQTCIVSFYIRRHSDPCAPGYWMSGYRCLLPSDLSHRIGG